MTLPAAGRRYPLRRCRRPPPSRSQAQSREPQYSDSLSEQRNNLDDDSLQLRRNVPEDPSESDHSEYEAPDHTTSDPEESRDGERSASDFEPDEVKPVLGKRKRPPKTKSSSKRKLTTDRPTEAKKTASDEENIELSAKQTELLDDIFSEFDTHKNGRVTLSNILRVADDHGFSYSAEEARHMVRFWDTSGTVTISRETFTKLAVEAKFMAPSAGRSLNTK